MFSLQPGSRSTTWAPPCINLLRRGRHLTVAVVVPAFNEAATLAETIRSIKRQSRVPDQIIVVDDCSTDRTGEIARALDVDVVRPERNQGTKAQAQNVALPHVTTDITVTVDADTTLAGNALELLVAPFERDPELTLASGYLVPRYLTTIWERGRLVEYLFGLELYRTAQAAAGSPMVCSGAFSAFRTSVLKSHGGFDAGTMAEDLNFTWKVHTTGGKATFVEDAICYPIDPPTWPVYFKQVDRWARAFIQNLLIFWRSLHRKPVLAAFIWAGVVEAFCAPVVLLVTLFLIVMACTGRAGFNWCWWLVSGIGLDIVLVSAFSVRGGVRTRQTSTVLRSIHLYYLLKTVNIWIWWRGFYLEVLAGRRLAAWAKGH